MSDEQGQCLPRDHGDVSFNGSHFMYAKGWKGAEPCVQHTIEGRYSECVCSVGCVAVCKNSGQPLTGLNRFSAPYCCVCFGSLWLQAHMQVQESDSSIFALFCCIAQALADRKRQVAANTHCWGSVCIDDHEEERQKPNWTARHHSWPGCLQGRLPPKRPTASAFPTCRSATAKQAMATEIRHVAACMAKHGPLVPVPGPLCLSVCL